MKKTILKLLTVLFCITSTQYTVAEPVTHNDILNNCMHAISNDENFKNIMTSEIFPDASMLNKETVAQNKSQIMGLIGSELLLLCSGNLSTLTKRANGKVWYERDGKTYAFQFKMDDLFSYLNIPTSIMVYNSRNLKSGDIIKLSDIPKLYWSDECSDHVIWDNLDDDAGVNVAGQKVFSQYGGSDNEFFLDFEEGNDRRAFPGLVLMDKTYSTKEELVSFNNLPTSIKAAQNFASALNGTRCANDGLAVYVVSTNVQKLSTDKEGWGIAAGIVGGATAVVGISSGLAALGVTSTLLTAASVSSTVPVVGWIVAGALAATAGAISLIPGTIQDVQQVMVLDGPYLIK